MNRYVQIIQKHAPARTNLYIQIIHIFYNKSDKVICINCTSFVHFVHTQKHVFFHDNILLANTEHVTSFHCSSCSYRTISSFHY